MSFSNILHRILFVSAFIVFPHFISAQETDSIAEKSEPAAVNTNSENFTDSAAEAKFKKVDAYILKLKKRNKPVTVLAKEITAPFPTEEEKVRALFIWMTNNIAFDCVTYHNKKHLQEISIIKLRKNFR